MTMPSVRIIAAVKYDQIMTCILGDFINSPSPPQYRPFALRQAYVIENCYLLLQPYFFISLSLGKSESRGGATAAVNFRDVIIT